MNRFDELFSLKNITTYSNTLGINEDVRKAYVGFTRKILKEHNVKKSQHAKLQCYQTIFSKIESRKKFTGFEKFVDLEFKTRIKLLSMVSSNVDTSAAYDDNHKNINTSQEYLNLLVSEIKKEKKEKLLYFSGGLDSELLAYIFLNNDINFTPVIFQFLDKNNEITNLEEISYAFNFCKKFCLTPKIENLYIEDFWTSDEFITIAKEFNIPSPHVITHAKMVFIMDSQFPNVAHYFGGEVRYIMDIPRNEETKLDLVFSEKLTKETMWFFPGSGTNYFDTGYDNSVATGSVTSLLWYGWTNLSVAIVGGGGAGGLRVGSVAGGGGGGGQSRTVALTKPSATWVRSIFVAAGKGGIPGTGGADGNGSVVYLFNDDAGFSTYKEMRATGGGTGYGSFDPGRGGSGQISNNNGSPTADDGSSITINNGSIIGGGGNASTGNLNGGGGSSGAAQGQAGLVGAGGNGADGQFVNIITKTGTPSGQFGAGGGGGATAFNGAPGGTGGLGFESSSITTGGNGGDGTALGNGTNGVNYFGSGGGGQGGGSSAGNGAQGLIRMYYWRT